MKRKRLYGFDVLSTSPEKYELWNGVDLRTLRSCCTTAGDRSEMIRSTVPACSMVSPVAESTSYAGEATHSYVKPMLSASESSISTSSPPQTPSPYAKSGS